MPTGAEEKRNKARILRWRGALTDSNNLVRWVVAIVLMVAGSSLTYTQLGFIALELPDGTVGYAVVLLEVVALGSLLLGTVPGMLLGLAIGGVLFLHAQYLPLDHYEMMFVTPTTSIVMFGVVGLLLGILFAFALRKNPGQIKRIIYITIICVFVSWLYSLAFSFSVIMSLIISLAENVGIDTSGIDIRVAATSTALRLGNLGLQAWITGLVMALLCAICDYGARKAQAHEGPRGLRTVFGAWLAVVVLLAFMSISAASFAVYSGDELRTAEQDMISEVNYLHAQVDMANSRIDMINEVFVQGELNYDKVDADLINSLSELFEDRLLLTGYTSEDDGIIVVSVGSLIYASDDPRFAEGSALRKVFDYQTREAIDRSIATGQMQRLVFTDPEIVSAIETDATPDDGLLRMGAQTYIAYLYAESAPLKFVDDDGENRQIDQKIIMIRSSDQVFSERPAVMIWMTLASLALLIVVFLQVFLLLHRVVARRIDEMNGVLARVTEGDLDARANVHDTSEFESLSEGINTTVSALKGMIAEVETRMDAELATAAAIQESALPGIFPPYPDIMKFDIYASMNAAKQVGGDFYDFFLIGDDCGEYSGKLGFVIADVSGKGVPAALFMMKAKALLRDYVVSGMELGEAVSEANRQLLEGNDESMFVTAWVGVLDYGTGHVDFVNAGHNPPLLWQRDGGWRWMREKSGPMLGLFEMTYRARSVECLPGDMFLLYTDGVTEAFDVDDALYGEERLLSVVEEGYRLHARELLESVRHDVAVYAEGAEQSDDITMLALEVGVPPEMTAVLDVPAELPQLNRVNEFLHAELDRRLCPTRVQNQLDIAVEELFVNVCKYAYANAAPDVPRTVRIYRSYSAEPPSVTVDIVDAGVAFDPLAKPDAVTPSDIRDVPIGGLGILMAKKCTDEMRYERSDGNNIVTIVKRW